MRVQGQEEDSFMIFKERTSEWRDPHCWIIVQIPFGPDLNF